jgi:hypothetical protein
VALFEIVSMPHLLSDAVAVRAKGEYHIVDVRQATIACRYEAGFVDVRQATISYFGTLLYMLIMFSYNIIEVKFV